MRVVFTGGGTAGHILPNIAVIDALSSRAEPSGPVILYIGEAGGLEEKICKKHGIQFRGIKAGKFRRYFSFKNFADIFKIPIGFFQSLRILKRFRPDLVFAKGGYVSVPVGLAAYCLRISLFIHESDISAGLSTKILAPIAEKIFISFPESKKFFRKHESKIFEAGIPLRSFIFKGKKEEGYKTTGFSHDLPVLLVMGGSIGAQSLNKILWNELPRLLKICQIVHVTGPGKMTVELSGEKRYVSYEYLDEQLPHIYAISDLIVSRAGASSIAEILALRKPNIFVPLLKHASRGDQILNAEMCKKHGFSEVFYEDEKDSGKFFKLVKSVLEDEQKKAAMAQAMSETAKFLKGSTGRVGDEILNFK